jgi:putative FmdB family regulatory protein
MPFYTYKCLDCEERFIKDHGMMDDPEFTCEKCKTPLKKLPGVGAVSFKGNGWGKDAR